MEATSALMHSGGSLTSGALIMLHEAHITLSQTASLNDTFKPWNTPWRKLGLDPMSRWPYLCWEQRQSIATSHLQQNCCMVEEWYRTYLSQHGMPVARDAKFVLASTSDKPLPKNAMTLVVSQTWENFLVDNTTRPYTSPDHPQVGTWSHRRELPTTTLLQDRIAQRNNTTKEPARHPRDSWEARISQPRRRPQCDTRGTAANGPRPITVEPQANSSESLTAEPVEPPVVTPASVEPAEELAGFHSRRISDKRVRFQPEQKRHYTRSGRLSKPLCQYNE